MRTRFGFKVDQMLFGFFVVVLVISDVTMVTNQNKNVSMVEIWNATMEIEKKPIHLNLVRSLFSKDYIITGFKPDFASITSDTDKRQKSK